MLWARFANIDPAVEQHVAKSLGLKPETVSTRVIPRDRHAMYFSVLAVIASSAERLAVEIRHLQRTELREAEDIFARSKGSSAMPHKRNPVLTENITGLARLVTVALHPGNGKRSAVARTGYIALIGRTHDRTGRHDYAGFPARPTTGVIEKLVVYPEQMQSNLDALGGLVFSQLFCWP